MNRQKNGPLPRDLEGNPYDSSTRQAYYDSFDGIDKSIDQRDNTKPMGSLVRIEQNSTSYDDIQKCDISSLRNDKNRSLGSVATSHKTS